MRTIKFEYGFSSVNGIVKKQYYLHEIPNIKEKCDVWNVLPIAYVRQFSGLHDKNGKEIYEQMELNNIFIIKWLNFRYVLFYISNLTTYEEIFDYENKLEITREYTEL